VCCKDLIWVYTRNEDHRLYMQRVKHYAKQKELTIIGITDGNIAHLMKTICLDVNYLLIDRCEVLSMSEQRVLSCFCRRKQIHMIVI